MRKLALFAFLLLSLGALDARAQADGETLVHEGDKGTLVPRRPKLLPASSPSGAVPFVDADGRATHDEGFSFDTVLRALKTPGIIIASNLLDWTNGLGAGTNEVSGGTHKSCATAKFAGGGASNNSGEDAFGRGDLGAGAGPVYLEDCDNGVPSTTHKRAQFSIGSWTPSTATSCIGIGTIGNYDPAASLVHKNALLLNPGRPLRIRSITIGVFGRQGTSIGPFGFATASDGSFTAIEKMYLDMYVSDMTGEFVQITHDTLGLIGATYVPGSRMTFEKDNAVGTVTDATDEKGGAVIDFDAGQLMHRELNIPIDNSGGDVATLMLCAENDDPDWTGDGTASGGTAASADWSIELEYDN